MPEYLTTAPDGRVAVPGGDAEGVEIWDPELEEDPFVVLRVQDEDELLGERRA